jgi:diguanylate cyclase (GGDEF)-like protein
MQSAHISRVRRQYPAIALALSAVILAGIAAVSTLSVSQLASAAVWVEHTHAVLETIDFAQRMVSDARRGEGGYLLTGDSARLQVVYSARLQLEDAIGRVSTLTRDNARQQQRLAVLRPLVGQELAAIDRAIALRAGNQQAAVAEFDAPSAQARLALIVQTLAAMRDDEQQLLDARTAAVSARVGRTLLILAFGYALAFALAMLALLRLRGERRQRREAEEELARANRELTLRVDELQTRTQQLAILGRIGDLLQGCQSRDEAAGVLSRNAPAMFAGTRGGIFRIAPSRNLLVPLVSWPDDAHPFTPADCWAMRRGVPHDSESGVRCRHAESADAAHALCVPLVAQGDMIGVLSLQWDDPQDRRELARAAAEQVALALANLDLQQTLRVHAIRDPLTGLFNRRYMEESLVREVHRAARELAPLTVLMFDLDRFKTYNDLFGHAAGDALLRELGRIITHEVRTEDIACRYGGDEFVVILPGCPADRAEQRARSLIEKTRDMPSAALPEGEAVTLSIGLAAFPDDATDPVELVAAADRALYEAKRGGRARVERAG